MLSLARACVVYACRVLACGQLVVSKGIFKMLRSRTQLKISEKFLHNRMRHYQQHIGTKFYRCTLRISRLIAKCPITRVSVPVPVKKFQATHIVVRRYRAYYDW